MDVVTYALSRKYTDKSIEGISGTLSGKNCTIASIEQVEGGNLVTFEWYSDEGESQTSTMFVQDGVLGEDAIAPTYDPTQTYNEGDLVVFENELYKLGASTTTGEFNPNVWDLTNIENLLNTKVNSNDLSTVATSGSYNDLSDTPTIPDAQIQSDWNQTNTNAKDYIKNKPSIPEDAADISYDNTTSGLEAENVQDAIDEVVADVDAVETALETKAEQNGVYDDLVAGNLLSDSYTADNAPYLYRQSPSASSVEQNIIGGTVVWNQICNNANSPTSRSGVTITHDNETFTFDGTASGAFSASGWFDLAETSNNYKSLSGHKVFISFKLLSGTVTLATSTRCYFTLLTTYSSASTVDYNNSKVFAFPEITNWSTDTRSNMIANNGVDFDNAKFHIDVIDLTQMFGSTIADYIYSLEQATAGSGIAWLKANGFLTKNYYAYNSGSLQSVKTSGRKVENYGANLVDITSITPTKQENGITFTVQQDGSIKANGTATGRCQIYWNVPSGVAKTFGGKWLSGNKAIEGCSLFLELNDSPWTNYGTDNGDGSTISNEIENASTSVNLTWRITSGTTLNNVVITPRISTYTTHTYPTSPIDLRGLFKLSNGNLVADGDVYSADGSVTRRYGIVDLGTLTWTYNSSAKTFYVRIDTSKQISTSEIANCICTKYVTISNDSQASDVALDKNISIGYAASNNWINIRDLSYTDAATFKTAMNGVYLVYELTTPTSETADAYENPQLVGSTEEFIDTRDVPIPVGGERKYHTDLKAKLEELAKIPDVPSANGTYKLIATRSASGVTYSWESN